MSSLSLAWAGCGTDKKRNQARYFKQMLKEAGHLESVKRVRVSEKDLAPFLPHYEVNFVLLGHDSLLIMS